jgi:hypothetical protein
MVAFAYAFAGLFGVAGLRVETATPGALCPGIAAVREAVDARVGTIEGPGEWRASYGLVHRPESEQADVVRLELFDPGGELRLRRDLPRAGQSCTAVTQAMVLVLESFFRRTGETEDVPSAAADVVVAKSAAPPAPTRRPVTAVSLLGGWTTGPASPAVGVDLRVTGMFARPWEVGLGAAWLLAEQQQAIGSGAATQQSYAFRLHLDRRWNLGGALTARLGPEVVVALDRAAASALPEGTTSFRAAFGLGAGAALEARVSRWLALSVLSAADYTPAAWSGRYVVGGYAGPEIFPPPRWRILVAGGLTVSLPE